MSITFPTTDQKVPSGITALPSEFKRPAFGTLYGFDADADEAVTVDGAITTELSEPLTTENGDILIFEPA